VSTDVHGVGDFIGDILEAAEFYEHLQGGAEFRATCKGPGAIALPSPDGRRALLTGLGG
jgi:hypothetical protein